MQHRYLNLHWWSLRFADLATNIFPDQLVMSFIARSALFGGEPELGILRSIVPPTQVALDVGAANGVYAWHLARIAAGCIAFEPNPTFARILEMRLPDVQVMPFALSNFNRQTKLRIPLRTRTAIAGWATIEAENQLLEFDQIQEIAIESKTLDSMDLQNVGFIKIDVEGHEMSVLLGGESCILRERPVLLIEIEEKHCPGALKRVTEWLEVRDYYCDEAILSPQNYLFRPVN